MDRISTGPSMIADVQQAATEDKLDDVPTQASRN
jgi:hypothetical protein